MNGTLKTIEQECGNIDTAVAVTRIVSDEAREIAGAWMKAAVIFQVLEQRQRKITENL